MKRIFRKGTIGKVRSVPLDPELLQWAEESMRLYRRLCNPLVPTPGDYLRAAAALEEYDGRQARRIAIDELKKLPLEIVRL